MWGHGDGIDAHSNMPRTEPYTKVCSVSCTEQSYYSRFSHNNAPVGGHIAVSVKFILAGE